GLEERFVGVTGSYDTEIFIEEEGEAQSYKIEALKYFFIGGIVSSGYGYGIGIVDSGAEINNSTKLLYAKVDDHEIGIPLNERFDIRVDIEPPRLVVEPDTLFFSNQEGAENEVRLWNEGNDSLRIDSLSFSTFTASGWGLNLVSPDSTYSLFYAFGELEASTGFPTIMLSSDTLGIEFVAFDGCLICSSFTSKSSSSAVS